MDFEPPNSFQFINFFLEMTSKISAFSQLYITTNTGFFPINYLLEHCFFLILYHSALNIFPENIWETQLSFSQPCSFFILVMTEYRFPVELALILSGFFVTFKVKNPTFSHLFWVLLPHKKFCLFKVNKCLVTALVFTHILSSFLIA